VNGRYKCPFPRNKSFAEENQIRLPPQSTNFVSYRLNKWILISYYSSWPVRKIYLFKELKVRQLLTGVFVPGVAKLGVPSNCAWSYILCNMAIVYVGGQSRHPLRALMEKIHKSVESKASCCVGI